MSGDGSLSIYQKARKLTPETSKEELGEIYSLWRHDYDKVSTWLRSIARSLKLSLYYIVPGSVTGILQRITTAKVNKKL